MIDGARSAKTKRLQDETPRQQPRKIAGAMRHGRKPAAGLAGIAPRPERTRGAR
jgi:hypothetical protein